MLDDLALGDVEIVGQPLNLGAGLATNVIVEAGLWQRGVVRGLGGGSFPFLPTSGTKGALTFCIGHRHEIVHSQLPGHSFPPWITVAENWVRE